MSVSEVQVMPQTRLKVAQAAVLEANRSAAGLQL